MRFGQVPTGQTRRVTAAVPRPAQRTCRPSWTLLSVKRTPTGRITFSVSLLGRPFDDLYMQLPTPQFSFDSVSVEAFDEPWKRVSFLRPCQYFEMLTSDSPTLTGLWRSRASLGSL